MRSTSSRIAAATAFLVLAACGTASAAGLVYIDGHNTWLSSPDGVHKLQLNQNGNENRPWNNPAQAPDGRTVVSIREEIDGDVRPVLYLYGPDGKFVTANVMPVYSGATIPVYPLGLDIDWNGQAVAYGYSYCGFACESTYKGFWLTFSDNQGLYPSNPQGQSDAYFPMFYGRRVMFSDSGGNLFVQPDVAEAPFTSSYEGWLDHPTRRLTRVAAAQTGRQVAIEWTQYDESANLVGEGIMVGQHGGTIPSDVSDICELPTVGASSSPSFSPDGKQIAWGDTEGVKVAGAPNLVPGGGPCQLSSPVKVIAPGGSQPRFGGIDVGAIVSPPSSPQQPGGSGGDGGTSGGGGPLSATLSGSATRAAFRRGLKLRVNAAAAGRVNAVATVAKSVARRVRLSGARSRTLGPRGFTAAAKVVVARGSATAAAAGPVTITLKPTAKAKRRAKRMRRVTLTVKVTQGIAAETLKVKLK